MQKKSHIKQFFNAGHLLRSSILLLLFCCFTAGAIVPQTILVGSVLIEYTEHSGGESNESEEKSERDQEEDKDPCLSVLFPKVCASLIFIKLSAIRERYAKNTRENVTTPPPEWA